MHRLLKAAAAVTFATTLSSCSSLFVSEDPGQAVGDGTDVVVLRPVDGDGKLTGDWKIRPVRGNALMDCTEAEPSPYAVDPGVIAGCTPDTDHTFACWFSGERVGVLCLGAPFDLANRAVIQFPTVSHGSPPTPPKTPVPVAVALDDGTVCNVGHDHRYACGGGVEAVVKSRQWTVTGSSSKVTRTYYFGVADKEARLALA